MNQYNVWNKWGKLKTVVLGNHYSSDFFKDIKNSRIRSALQRIADETQKDLDYFESTLKDFGCCVLRPDFDKNDSIMNYIDLEGKFRGRVPKSPLVPRDYQLVVGNHLYQTSTDHHSIIEIFNNYNSNNIIQWYNINQINDIEFFYSLDLRCIEENHWKEISGVDWGSYSDYKNNPSYFNELDSQIKNEIIKFQKNYNNFIPLVDSPSITVVGRDIYVDINDKPFLDAHVKLLHQTTGNMRINLLKHGGHSDGCFHTLKPGAILSLNEIQAYEHTFPGWDVCYLPDQSWSKVEGFIKLRKQVNGKWWVPGEEDNEDFTYFVETWLQDWVGYVEETVFDVNVLVLDEHHVCVSSMNPIVTEFLKKHKMEPVHIPWRHRYFWDGGLHCITLDLEREGSQEDYFPERGDVGVIDHGFD